MSITLNHPIFDTQHVKQFNFNGGECQIKLPEILIRDLFSQDEIKITAHLRNTDDIMALLLTVNAIRECNRHIKINATIPYFPYARQDRVCNIGEALSIKVMADLINSLNLDSVEIHDPHSDVTPALINNCKVISIYQIIHCSPLGYMLDLHKPLLVSPDAGAEKKTLKVAQQFDLKMIYASKIRDTATGEITQTRLQATDIDLTNKRCLIVDDICDGGRTFYELAKILHQRTGRKCSLYVTHGIFSKGIETIEYLGEYIQDIYCANNMNEVLATAEVEGLTILNNGV